MGPVCLYTSKQFNYEQNTKIILLSRDKIANFTFHTFEDFCTSLADTFWSQISKKQLNHTHLHNYIYKDWI